RDLRRHVRLHRDRLQFAVALRVVRSAPPAAAASRARRARGARDPRAIRVRAAALRHRRAGLDVAPADRHGDHARHGGVLSVSAQSEGGGMNRERWAGLIAGGIALAVYVATTQPYVHSGDPGEFQTLASVGGIAHAGYVP